MLLSTSILVSCAVRRQVYAAANILRGLVVVGIVIRLWGQRSGVLIPGQARDLFLSERVQIDSRVHSPSYSMDTVFL